MRSSTYKNYLLVLLMVILAFNYMDRMALGLVLQDIKLDLGLSDTQLGFLSGIAFALFYSVMGIPIARWADRGNRVAIIVLTTVLWSAAVSLCGVATTFMQLLFIRVAVAVGEAGCIPPAHSLIADHFARAERPRAVARYMLGVPLALAGGYFAAGWLNEFYGWRTTFIILGLPGLALALIAGLTLNEPRRTKSTTGEGAIAVVPPSQMFEPASSEPTMTDVFAALWRNNAFRHLLICFSVWYFFGYGLLQWQPAFFVRSHSLETGEIGTWFSLIYGLGGGLGVYLGGEFASRYAANNEPLQLKACACAFTFFALLNVCALVAPNYYLAFVAMGIANLGGNMAQGPILASIQTLVRPRMRAMSLAIIYLFANLIGMGLGPLTAGVLSDALSTTFGDDSLRYALVLLCPGYFWASWHLWCASRTVLRDLAVAHAGADSALNVQQAVAAAK